MKESHHFIYNLSDEMRSVFTYLALSVNFILFYLMWLKQCEYVHLYAIINVNSKICTLWPSALG